MPNKTTPRDMKGYERHAVSFRIYGRGSVMYGIIGPWYFSRQTRIINKLQSICTNLNWCTPPKVLLLCRSWGACMPRRDQRLCQLEFWLLVGTTMLDRLWARGQTKCNTLLMLATSVFGRILLTTLLWDVLVKVQAGHLMAQWRGMHGSCLVPFVMLTPTILRGRVPCWLRCG